MIHTVSGVAIRGPAATPERFIPWIRALALRGTQRDSTAVAAGKFRPSARPSSPLTRYMSSGTLANGVSRVKKDHPRLPAARTFLPPNRSPRSPAGICVRIYPTPNMDMTSPMMPMSQPKCFMIAGAATEKLTRSK